MSIIYSDLLQKTKAPLPPDQVADIFEDLKDMRLLVGKNGFKQELEGGID